MIRILTVCTCAIVTVLLLSSDASAQCPVNGYVVTYSPSGISYDGYATAYGGYAPNYGYASSYSYAPSYTTSYRYTPSYSYTPSYGYASSYGYSGYDFGRPGYNPGGLGGPWSGLGVRPGVGLGGFGLRR